MYTYQPIPENTDLGFTGYMVDESSTIKTVDFSGIYRSKAFNECMKYFDTDDDMTRGVLLTVNEADQNIVMQALANKLYKHITDKVDEIDFGTIPNSRGDITKIDNYSQLCDCVNIITEILQQYHQDITPIETVSTAIANMNDRIDMFTKGYRINAEMPMVIYNTMVLSIVSSVSFMISSCIEFVKLPDDRGFDLAVDKAGVSKTRDYVIFKDLAKWNKLCANGQFDKCMNYTMQGTVSKGGNTSFAPAAAIAIGVVAASLAAVLIVVPLIRELIFFFYYSRTKLSEYLETQADLIAMNAYNVENTLTRDEKSRKEIAAKQRKIADRLRKASNKLKVNYKTSEQSSNKDIDKLDKEKLKMDDVVDQVPDSANAALF